MLKCEQTSRNGWNRSLSWCDLLQCLQYVSWTAGGDMKAPQSTETALVSKLTLLSLFPPWGPIPRQPGPYLHSSHSFRFRTGSRLVLPDLAMLTLQCAHGGPSAQHIPSAWALSPGILQTPAPVLAFGRPLPVSPHPPSCPSAVRC